MKAICGLVILVCLAPFFLVGFLLGFIWRLSEEGLDLGYEAMHAILWRVSKWLRGVE